MSSASPCLMNTAKMVVAIGLEKMTGNKMHFRVHEKVDSY